MTTRPSQPMEAAIAELMESTPAWPVPVRLGATARALARALAALTILSVAGFMLLVLIGLWDRHEQQTAAWFGGLYASAVGVLGGAQSRPATDPGLGRKQLPAALLFPPAQKLGGAAIAASTYQGMSVALSADGRTAVVGAPGPNAADRDRAASVGPAGAAWVFARAGAVWRREAKLVGSTSAQGGGLWSQGMSVALSADGTTAVVGGPSDDMGNGAAWIFTRGTGPWRQQGEKLVGSGPHSPADAASSPGRGLSVALSADGNTALVGGWRTEGAWVFTRSGDVWTQQGRKLVGSGAAGSARQGISVALSADGNTAILGGSSDNGNTGAAWIFVRSGEAWAQQGRKLVGSGAVGGARQGTSVALSADGNIALLGGPGDNPWDGSVPFGLGAAGAAWVFARHGSSWEQQGSKLVGGSGAARIARRGTAVALSADGKVALLGGVAGDRGNAAAVLFTRSGVDWTQERKLTALGGMGSSASAVALSADGGIALIGDADDDGGIGAAWVPERGNGGSDEQTPPMPSVSRNLNIPMRVER
ncbi:MAG TPA: hypothetical protein VGF60_22505 [Xanthobacteraceae bacterium]